MVRKHAQFILPIIMILLINCSGPKGTEELIKTDKAFSDLSRKLGMQTAFIQYAAESAVLLQKNSQPIRGKLAMEKSFKTYSDTGIVLSWGIRMVFHG